MCVWFLVGLGRWTQVHSLLSAPFIVNNITGEREQYLSFARQISLGLGHGRPDTKIPIATRSTIGTYVAKFQGVLDTEEHT